MKNDIVKVFAGEFFSLNCRRLSWLAGRRSAMNLLRDVLKIFHESSQTCKWSLLIFHNSNQKVINYSPTLYTNSREHIKSRHFAAKSSLDVSLIVCKSRFPKHIVSSGKLSRLGERGNGEEGRNGCKNHQSVNELEGWILLPERRLRPTVHS